MRRVFFMWLERIFWSLFPSLGLAFVLTIILYIPVNAIFLQVGFLNMLQCLFSYLFGWATASITSDVVRNIILPARRCKEKYHVPWNFALKHYDKSKAFIEFMLDKPEGYKPWNTEAFLRFVQDNASDPEASQHPDISLRGRGLTCWQQTEEVIPQRHCFSLQMSADLSTYRSEGRPVSLTIDGKVSTYICLDDLVATMDDIDFGFAFSSKTFDLIRHMVGNLRLGRGSQMVH